MSDEKTVVVCASCGKELTISGTKTQYPRGTKITTFRVLPCSGCKDTSYQEGRSDGQLEFREEMEEAGVKFDRSGKPGENFLIKNKAGKWVKPRAGRKPQVDDKDSD